MIIWIASYPKSGNTWMRTIVSSLLHSDDGVFDFSSYHGLCFVLWLDIRLVVKSCCIAFVQNIFQTWKSWKYYHSVLFWFTVLLNYPKKSFLWETRETFHFMWLAKKDNLMLLKCWWITNPKLWVSIRMLKTWLEWLILH